MTSSQSEQLQQADTLLAQDPVQAEKLYHELDQPGTEPFILARARYGLGAARFYQGRMAEARAVLETCTALCGQEAEWPLLAGRAYALLGRVCIALDDFEKGVPHAYRALELLEHALAVARSEGADEKSVEHSLAVARFFLSSAEYQKRHFHKAELLTKAAMETWERLQGRASPDVATCLNNLGRIYEERQDFQQALAFHREAAAIYEKTLGTHPQTAFSFGNLGTALASAGKWQDAIEHLRKALEYYAALGRDSGPEIDGYRNNLKVCEQALQDEAD